MPDSGPKSLLTHSLDTKDSCPAVVEVSLLGRPSIVLIRVAETRRYDRERELKVVGWVTIIITIAVIVILWIVLSIAALGIASQIHLLKRAGSQGSLGS